MKSLIGLDDAPKLGGFPSFTGAHHYRVEFPEERWVRARHSVAPFCWGKFDFLSQTRYAIRGLSCWLLGRIKYHQIT